MKSPSVTSSETRKEARLDFVRNGKFYSAFAESNMQMLSSERPEVLTSVVEWTTRGRRSGVLVSSEGFEQQLAQCLASAVMSAEEVKLAKVSHTKALNTLANLGFSCFEGSEEYNTIFGD